MLKNVGRLALALLMTGFFVTGFAGSALAQDEMEDDVEPTGDDWSSDSTSSSTTSPPPEAPVATADSGSAAKMGLLIPIFNNFDLGGFAALIGGDQGFSTANLLYGLDADTYLNLQLGINFGPGSAVDDGMGNQVAGDDVFGLKVGVGYRMYKPTKGKIRPYLEPSVALAISDFGNAGDVLDLNLGALMGVDYLLWEQITIGAAIGANLAFNDAFDSINFNLLTTGMNATFWW